MTTKFPICDIVPFFFMTILAASAATNNGEPFLRCLSLHFQNSTAFSELVYTQNNPSYSSVLNSDIYNLRFAEPDTPKPLVIVTPLHASHIQSTIFCAKTYGLHLRTRSGGHDFEGLSYVSPAPFVVLDLINLTSIHVDVGERTAWVHAGATLGEVYYAIAQKSRTLAFPGGFCPTVAVGGHISGGGYGALIRKYGMAADHIADAILIDGNGRILDRESMGEDLFWAIRGGGGGSFGVILAWKLKLVPVPETMTHFSVNRMIEQNAIQLFDQWQVIGNELPEDLYLEIILTSENSSQTGNRTIQANFNSLFLGGVDKLIPLLEKGFPELGITETDCEEMSWIESTLRMAMFPAGTPLETLLNRSMPVWKGTLKAKSDYVKKPIQESAIEDIWKTLFEPVEDQQLQIIFIPYGGKMAEISEGEIPYSHRAGNLYKLLYLVYWTESGTAAAKKHVSWTRWLYDYMSPYVSSSPRQAYINYRDLDIGRNNEGYTSHDQASVWGVKYFGANNFNRLIQVKAEIDPENFFRNEQSIPSLFLYGM